MAIINRLAQLFKADFHAVLDHIEEPELQLKQAVREMEESLSGTTQQITRLKLRRDDLADRQTNAEQLIKQTDEEIAVCFEHKDEALARGLVRRKLEAKAVLSTLIQRQEKINKELNTLETQHAEQLCLYESMQQKAELVRSDAQPVDACKHDIFTVKDSDVEIALLKEKQRYTCVKT